MKTFTAWQLENMLSDIERKSRKRNKISKIQIIGSLTLLALQLTLDLTGIIEFPWSLLWILVIILWGWGCIRLVKSVK